MNKWMATKISGHPFDLREWFSNRTPWSLEVHQRSLGGPFFFFLGGGGLMQGEELSGTLDLSSFGAASYGSGSYSVCFYHSSDRRLRDQRSKPGGY